MAQDIEPFPVANRRQLALAGGGAIGLAVVLFAGWYMVLRTPMVPAFVDLKPADAALIVGEMERTKTPYSLADNGAAILVPRDRVDAARVAILGGDLPLKGTVGFELFSKSDMGLTEFAQKINYQRALQGELARTLMSMSGVDSARVHITLPEAGIFQDDHRPAKASVTVVPKTGGGIEGPAVIGIQRLVASAVEDLDAANVVVLDGAGRQLSAAAPAQEEDVAAGTVIEQAYAGQVRAVMAQLVTDPAMRVTVWTPRDAMVAPNASGETERRFPLRITVALSSDPTPALRARVEPLLASSIGYDPANGDMLQLIRLPPLRPYEVAPPPVATVKTQRDADSDAAEASTPWIAWIVALICISAIVVMLWRRRRGAGAMTAIERGAFAARLRVLLEEDERLSDGRA
ncbi:MAG TPA: flagellar basal-body MS-ring/collar protein FliF [Novosphingobium sp.]